MSDSSATKLGSDTGNSTAGAIVSVMREWAADHMRVFREDAAKTKSQRRDYETMSIALTMAAGEIEKRFCK